jgi:hypothetical protein
MGGGKKLLRNRASMHIMTAKIHDHQSFLKLISSRHRRINDMKPRIPIKKLTWAGRKILRKANKGMPVDIKRPVDINTLDIMIRLKFIILFSNQDEIEL